MFVPVTSQSGNTLMPTNPNKAGVLVKKGLATPYWSNGIFCIRLNYDTKAHTQDICVGVDPGSKKEGFTVKSEAHTYLNIQADAQSNVGKKVAKRRELRRGRRSRKCPNRKQKKHNLSNRHRIPAGTRARWHWKLRILDWLSKLYPVRHVCVEDIKAHTKQYQKKWNQSFSPLEVGKQWFYSEIQRRWQLSTVAGHQTKDIRDTLGLKKSKDKKAETFDAHCVDSWCLAYHVLGGDPIVNNTDIFCISPIPIQRRSLHREVPKKGGIRSRYGGTRCLGYTKGTLVKSIKWGLCWISGHQNGKINLTQMTTGKQRPQQKSDSFKVLKRLNFRYKQAEATSPS